MYFNSIGHYLKFGSGNEQLSTYSLRRQYYNLSVRREASETLVDSCTRHFRKISRDIINNFSETVLQDITDNSLNKNSTDGDKITRIELDRNFYKGSSNFKKLDKLIDKYDLNISHHSIIPLSLILRFFDEWSESFSVISNSEQCLNMNSASFSQLNRQFLNNSGAPDSDVNQFFTNHSILDDLRNHLSASDIGGNFFLGPDRSSRGLFFPRHNELNFEAMFSFEFDSEPIIGEEHYRELLVLFKRLIGYVAMDSEEVTPLERYTSGFELYVSMMTTFSSYEAASFNIDQWEYRTATEEELSTLNLWKRSKYRGRKFWVIKKNFRRPKRNVIQEKKVCYSIDQYSKQRWSEFVVYLMRAFVKAEASNQTIPWSGEFSWLYLKYRINLSLSNATENCMDEKFDTFLYYKISQYQEWSDCISFKESDESNEWCQAWMRIMLNTDVGSSSSWKDPRQIQFHQDLTVIVDWLRDKIVYEYPTKSMSSQVSDKKVVCYRNALSLACPNVCRSLVLPENDDIFYERKWILENDNIIQCRCPENTDNTSRSIFQWFKHLWEGGMNSPCVMGLPEYNLTRYTDLR